MLSTDTCCSGYCTLVTLLAAVQAVIVTTFFPWWPNQNKRCFPLTCVVRNMIYFWLHLPHLWLRLIQGFSIKAKARGKTVSYDCHCNLVHHTWGCRQHDYQCTGQGGSVHQTVPGITFPYLNNSGAAKKWDHGCSVGFKVYCLGPWKT